MKFKRLLSLIVVFLLLVEASLYASDHSIRYQFEMSKCLKSYVNHNFIGDEGLYYNNLLLAPILCSAKHHRYLTIATRVNFSKTSASELVHDSAVSNYILHGFVKY